MKKKMMLRWLMLLVLLVNIIFNYTYGKLFDLTSIDEVTWRYDSLFTPAGYAFTIWGIIYLYFLCYAGYQLVPSQRNVPLYDQLALPLIIANLLGIAWIASFGSGLIGLSTIIITAMLGVAVVLYKRSRAAISPGSNKSFVALPFSIYLSWLSVATIANVSLYLLSAKWWGSSWGPESWAVIMLCVATALAVLINARYHDIAYPLVIIWGVFSIFVQRKDDHPYVAKAALLMCMVMLAWTLIYALAGLFRNATVSHN